jgi:polyvinyl alcohol dehydrogenase (cytochrome)
MGARCSIAGQKSGNVWAHDPDKQGAVVWKTALVNNTTEFGGKIIWGGAADGQNAYFGLGSGGNRRGPNSRTANGNGFTALLSPPRRWRATVATTDR